MNVENVWQVYDTFLTLKSHPIPSFLDLPFSFPRILKVRNSKKNQPLAKKVVRDMQGRQVFF